MYKAPSFGLGMKKDLRESIESVYDINNTINEEEQLIISLFEEFLDENYYVDMLTEEDLDYVFENEFPQWLEEQMTKEEWLEYPLNERSLSASHQREQLAKMGLRKTRDGKIIDVTGKENRVPNLIWRNKNRKIFSDVGLNNDDIINTPRGRNLDTSDVTTKSAKRSADGAVLTKWKPAPKPAAPALSPQQKKPPLPTRRPPPPTTTTPKPAPKSAASDRKVRSRRTGGSELGRKLMKIGTKVRANPNTDAGRRKIALLNKYKGRKNNNWASAAFTSEN